MNKIFFNESNTLISSESLVKEGYKEWYGETLDYKNGNLLTFQVADRIDMYYVSDTQFCQLVTGNTRGRGNRTLFEGMVSTIDELKWIVKSVSYYNNKKP